MLTPQFSLRQDDEFVYVTIRAPYVKISEVDMVIEGSMFQFYVAPYFLRLCFDGELIEDGREKTQFDVDKNEFHVILPKKERGPFPNLDMQTLLMSRRQRRQHQQQRQHQQHMIQSSEQGQPGASEAQPAQVTPGFFDDGLDDEGRPRARPLIQVLSSQDFDSGATSRGNSGTATTGVAHGDEPLEGEAGGDEDAEDGYEWEIEQTFHEEPLFGACGYAYGFDAKYSGTLSTLQQELPGITLLDDPDNTGPSRRRALRIQHEDDHFSVDHYLGDYAEQEALLQVLSLASRWGRHLDALDESRAALRRQWLSSASHRGRSSGDDERDEVMREAEEEAGDERQMHADPRTGAVQLDPRRQIPFTEEEQEDMRRLRRVEVLSCAVPRALLTALDIVCAYLYEYRATEGEFSVESGWTVRTLSSCLSFLDEFTSAREVVYAFVARSLAYPLYRSWPLSQRVLQDVRDVLLLGKPAILQCLLGARRLLAADDVRYVLNDIYLNDLCVWLQGVPGATVDSFAAHVCSIEVHKQHIRFPLEAIEGLLDADDAGDSDEDDEDESSSSDDDDEDDDTTDSSDEEEGEGEEEEEQGEDRGGNEEEEEGSEHETNHTIHHAVMMDES